MLASDGRLPANSRFQDSHPWKRELAILYEMGFWIASRAGPEMLGTGGTLDLLECGDGGHRRRYTRRRIVRQVPRGFLGSVPGGGVTVRAP